MRINGINGANPQMGQIGMNQATDAYSRNIQDRIVKAQKQLQELSVDENMSLEEKMKKRQEIQQEISDLNMQLRQHQMEQRRAAQNRSEKQQAEKSSAKDMLGYTNKAESKSTGLSQASMMSMISADSSIKQAKVQGSVATGMKGRAGVLDSEIKLDKVRGYDTQAKEEELARVEQKAQAATTSQISILADAGRTMKEAAQADSRTQKADSKDTDVKGTDAGVKEKDAEVKEKGAEESIYGTEEQEENVSAAKIVNTQSDNSASRSTQTAEATASPQPTAYTSVDIRL